MENPNDPTPYPCYPSWGKEIYRSSIEGIALVQRLLDAINGDGDNPDLSTLCFMKYNLRQIQEKLYEAAMREKDSGVSTMEPTPINLETGRVVDSALIDILWNKISFSQEIAEKLRGEAYDASMCSPLPQVQQRAAGMLHAADKLTRKLDEAAVLARAYYAGLVGLDNT